VIRLPYRRVSAVAIAFGWVVASAIPMSASAYFNGGCVANINPTTMDVGTATAFTISLTNASFADIHWVDINVPSASYSYAGNSVTSWTSTDHDGGTTLTEGTLSAQRTEDLPITAAAGLQPTSAENWVVRTSTNADGSGAITCTGSLGTSITGSMPQDNVNGVSGISVADITPYAATINWATDNPSTSLVYYGLSSGYGSTSDYSADYVSGHSVQLTNLHPKTTYHFQVVGSDVNSNYAYSIDNTFVTAEVPVVVPPNTNTNPVTNNAPTKTPVVTNKGTLKDTVPPQIAVATQISGAYKAAPMISGTATDNSSVANVEYSTDDGLNWLPVDKLDRTSPQSVKFSFTPTLTQDGNYLIEVRAIDAYGNTTVSAVQKLVIDQLPPLVGGIVSSLGPQMIKPDANGVVRALVGSDQKITTSAIGGATSVVVDAARDGKQNATQSFSLTQIAGTDLWSGALNFTQPGTYQLSVRALDGAGNTTSRTLNTVVAETPSTISDTKTSKPVVANVAVYYRDPETKTWVKWDASSYSQSNPLKTSKAGRYGLYLPGGTYYLEASAPGYMATLTKSFTITEPTIVSASMKLRHRPSVHIGKFAITLPWANFSQAAVGAQVNIAKASMAPTDESQAIPNFSIEQTDGTSTSLDKLYGKPTIMSFVSTWASPAQDQISILSSMSGSDKAYNVLAIDSGESKAWLKAYVGVAGYGLPLAIDADSRFINSLHVSGLPTTYFIDRHGVVKKVVVGVLSKQELLKYVSSGL
jgi:cytochrome c biogenesis protein CcmG/thiol:disulfide interchange protein DsbE